MSSTASSLDDLATCGGVTAVFHAGGTALGHHWQVYGQNGSQLARTTRVHNGGMLAQAFWTTWTVTGMGVGDNIHVELRGADDRILLRASAINDKPAVVTAVDPTGRQVVRSVRDKTTLTLNDHEDHPLAEMQCAQDGPWPVRNPAGDVLGELVAGEPGPSTSIGNWAWIDPQSALNASAYARSMHLGLRRVRRYSFAPTGQMQPALALLPLLCGLTY